MLCAELSSLHGLRRFACKQDDIGPQSMGPGTQATHYTISRIDGQEKSREENSGALTICGQAAQGSRGRCGHVSALVGIVWRKPSALLQAMARDYPGVKGLVVVSLHGESLVPAPAGRPEKGNANKPRRTCHPTSQAQALQTRCRHPHSPWLIHVLCQGLTLHPITPQIGRCHTAP